MRDLQSMADELLRRQRVTAQVKGDQLIIPVSEEDVIVSRDEEHGRVTLWGEVADVKEEDSLRAAQMSLRYNDQFAFARAVTLGVSTTARCAILGRSLEAPDMDCGRLLTEARDFAAELRASKAWFERAMAAR